MIRKSLVLPLLAVLCGCSTPTMPPEVVRAHLEAEVAARKMEPRVDQAVVYLFYPDATAAWPLRLSIDGTLALRFDHSEWGRSTFYMLCLNPGTFRFAYEFPAFFNGTVNEFMTLEAGKIYARDIDSRGIAEIPAETARSLLRSRTLAPDPKYPVGLISSGPSPYSVYQNSPFRCKS